MPSELSPGGIQISKLTNPPIKWHKVSWHSGGKPKDRRTNSKLVHNETWNPIQGYEIPFGRWHTCKYPSKNT